MQPIAFAVLVASLTACGVEQAGADYAEGLGTPQSPVPGIDAYAVTSPMTIPLELPDVAARIMALREFSVRGGYTLLAQSAGTSARSALDALPVSLRTKLESWIDAELDKSKIGTKTVRQVSGELATIADDVVSHFVVESSLTITPTSASHTLRDLNFTPGNLDIIVPIGGLTADTLVQKTTAVVGEGGALEIGDQRFSLAFGSHAWQAINLASTTMFGGDISILEHADCDTVARNVAARCVSGVCVGHVAELLAVCHDGLASLVSELRGAIAPIELGTLRFAHGSARMVDTTGDGVADRILDGTWDAETDVGLGVRKSSVAFTALD